MEIATLIVSAVAAIAATAAFVHSFLATRAQRRADLVARQGVIHDGEPDDKHLIHLTNAGGSTARHVRLRVAGEDGEDLTAQFGAGHFAAGDTEEVNVLIPARSGRGQRRLFLHARWLDTTGEHDEQLLELRPLR